jgi:hypothetical protein
MLSQVNFYSKHQTINFYFISGDLSNSSFFWNKCSQVGKSHDRYDVGL